MKTLVVVADSSLIVETIRLALRAAGDVNVIGKLDGRTDIRGSLRLRRPHVVLVDEMEDPQHALERIADCRDELPDTSVVVLTSRMDAPWTGRALAAGAHACVSKAANLPGLGAIIPVGLLLAYNVATTGHLFHPGYEYQYQKEASGYQALGYNPDWAIDPTDPRWELPQLPAGWDVV